MLPSTNLFLLLGICLLSLAVASGSDAENYKVKFLIAWEKGLSCNPGYNGVSNRVFEAADECERNGTASYICFANCMYTHFGYFQPGQKPPVDIGMGDLITSEMFDMEIKRGRKSYARISRQRQRCAHDYLIEPDVYFPRKFDNANDCEVTREFFRCSWRNLFCNRDNKVNIQ